MTLDQLERGDQAVVVGVDGEGPSHRRLLDLGLIPGTTVAVELRSPLGDPTAYRVRGATIALRRGQARVVRVRRENT